MEYHKKRNICIIGFFSERMKECQENFLTWHDCNFYWAWSQLVCIYSFIQLLLESIAGACKQPFPLDTGYSHHLCTIRAPSANSASSSLFTRERSATMSMSSAQFRGNWCKRRNTMNRCREEITEGRQKRRQVEI